MTDQTLGTVVPFLYEGTKPIRTAPGPDGEPWFVLADLCAVLDISQPATVIRRLDDDEYMTANVYTGRLGTRPVTVVSEAGVYETIMRSNRPEAKKLRRFVTHEVLPALRRDGYYLTDGYRAELALSALICHDTIESMLASDDKRQRTSGAHLRKHLESRLIGMVGGPDELQKYV